MREIGGTDEQLAVMIASSLQQGLPLGFLKVPNDEPERVRGVLVRVRQVLHERGYGDAEIVRLLEIARANEG